MRLRYVFPAACGSVSKGFNSLHPLQPSINPYLKGTFSLGIKWRTFPLLGGAVSVAVGVVMAVSVLALAGQEARALDFPIHARLEQGVQTLALSLDLFDVRQLRPDGD